MQIDSDTSEGDLIEHARAGSIRAFEQLVLRHQDRLFRFLLARSSCRADAEDALQEAFVAAFRHLHTYRNRYRFTTWLYTIARRKLAQAYRQRPSIGEHSTEMVSDEPGPEQLGIAVEQRRSVWKLARECLPEVQFSALWLYYVEEMPIAEIAVVLKRPRTWVKVNLYRARGKLGKLLEAPAIIESPGVTGEIGT